MTPTCFDPRDHRIGPAEDEGCVRELVDRGTPGEKLDDAGKDSSPGTAFETPSVDRSLRHARGCRHGPHRCNTGWELGANSERAPVGRRVHATDAELAGLLLVAEPTKLGRMIAGRRRMHMR